MTLQTPPEGYCAFIGKQVQRSSVGFFCQFKDRGFSSVVVAHNFACRRPQCPAPPVRTKIG